MKAGDKVRFMDAEWHERAPEYYPPVRTVGVVCETTHSGSLRVQWPEGSTAGKGLWWCASEIVELVEEADPC